MTKPLFRVWGKPARSPKGVREITGDLLRDDPVEGQPDAWTLPYNAIVTSFEIPPSAEGVIVGDRLVTERLGLPKLREPMRVSEGLCFTLHTPPPKAPSVDYKAHAEKLAQAIQREFEDSGWCAACDLHTHADDCPVRIVLGLPDEPEECEDCGEPLNDDGTCAACAEEDEGDYADCADCGDALADDGTCPACDEEDV